MIRVPELPEEDRGDLVETSLKNNCAGEVWEWIPEISLFHSKTAIFVKPLILLWFSKSA